MHDALDSYEAGADMAELLLAHKADVNARDNADFTPLHEAAELGYKDLAEVLLANETSMPRAGSAIRLCSSRRPRAKRTWWNWFWPKGPISILGTIWAGRLCTRQ